MDPYEADAVRRKQTIVALEQAFQRAAEELSKGSLPPQVAPQPQLDISCLWSISEQSAKYFPPSQQGSSSYAPPPGYEQVSILFQDPGNPSTPLCAKGGSGNLSDFNDNEVVCLSERHACVVDRQIETDCVAQRHGSA